MNNSKLYYLLREPKAAEGFRTAVSLHSHTLHSKESTAFVCRIANRSKLFNWFIRGQLKKYSERYGDKELTNLEAQAKRMWWTSPLSAVQAWQVETGQISDKLGLEPIVSITDHDTIEAPQRLQMVADHSEAPVSVEWTTPYQKTYFHLGVHNMHPTWAPKMMSRMVAYTANPDPATLEEMLRELDSHPDVLIVFNHPEWDQSWIGPEAHRAVIHRFVEEYREVLHAVEINGLRSWTENRRVVRFARATGMKLISGGDRHGREPNATLNLTNASTFSEFAAEIRGGGASEMLIMPQFHDPLMLRVIQGLGDVLKDHPEHALGQTRWSERVFRLCYEGDVKSLDQFFEGKEPYLMKQMHHVVSFLTGPRMRRAWQRAAIPAEAAL